MVYQFISGGVMVCCLLAGFFFHKFWTKTHDKLFKQFAISFYLMSFERVVLLISGTRYEPSPQIYLIRLVAFSIIIYAIIKKNQESSNNVENT